MNSRFVLLFVGPSKWGGCSGFAVGLEIIVDDLFKSSGRREGSGSVRSCTIFQAGEQWGSSESETWGESRGRGGTGGRAGRSIGTGGHSNSSELSLAKLHMVALFGTAICFGLLC